MTYAQDEASRESSNPRELYKFVGTFTTYYRTSSNSDINFNDGGGAQDYLATPMSRSNLVIAPDGQPPEMTVIIPTSDAISQAYVFQVAPPDLECTIYRRHASTGNWATYWKGPVTGFSVAGYEVTMRIPHPLKQLGSDKIPNVFYQPFCNNVLFDTVCSISATPNWTESAQVLSISGNGKTITFYTAGGIAYRGNSYAPGGEMVTANGERRMILTQAGDVITVLWPFSSDLAVDDFVDVITGCDHALTTCVNKFDNVDNFNGMPYILGQEMNGEQGGTN